MARTLKISAIAISITGALTLAFLFGREPELTSLLKGAGYWLMAAWSALWLRFAFRPLTRAAQSAVIRMRRRERNAWVAVLAVLGGSAFLASRESFGFKITMDEVVLSATSMSMHFGRSAAGISRGCEIAGVFESLSLALDKRPFLFPWLTSLVHDVTGYRVENAFYLNAVLTGILLSAVYRIGAWLRDPRTGIFAILLLVSLPLLAQNATGGGFEILNAVLILTAVITGIQYVRKPDVATLGLFVFSVVLLANTRYESVAFIPVAGGIILFEWWLRRRIFAPWPVWVAPWMCVPMVWHWRVVRATPEFWQLPSDQTPAFHFSRVVDNFAHFLNYVTDLRSSSSPALAIATVFGLGFTAMYAVRYWIPNFRRCPAQVVWFAFLAGVVVNTLLLFSYHWGMVDRPEASRLILPLLVFGSLAGSFVLGEFVQSRTASRVIVGLVGISILAFTLPVSSRAIVTVSNYHVSRIRWLNQFHDELPRGRYLFFARNSLGLLVHRVSALHIATARQVADRVDYHQRRGTFENIYVVQNIFVDPVSGERIIPIQEDVGAAYTLEPVAEHSFRPFQLTRISRVTAVDPSVPSAPPTSAQLSLLPVELGDEMRYDQAELHRQFVGTLP